MAKKKHKPVWTYKFKNDSDSKSLALFYETHGYAHSQMLAVAFLEGKMVGFDKERHEMMKHLRDQYIVYGIWLARNNLINVEEEKKPITEAPKAREKMYG